MTYQKTNNLVGWVVFFIAAMTYCLTVEPSASFWDCPEFITTAYKLEVGHPPGAPFFMLTGNLFSQFADSPSQVAFMINIMSALLSAFCILFLFWTITHLARMLICENGVVTTTTQTVKIMSAGIVGALCYTWSDTFWFSAVEAEVYAYSSMFTALVFWLILKWEDHADEPHSDRWIVLIAYLTGLSIGVHLLNLLCLPAIALVYYYKRQPEAKLKGSLVALAVGFLLVAAVLFGIVPGIVKVGGWFELFFVNIMGMSFNSGMVVYLILLIAVVLSAIFSTTRYNRTLTNTLYVASVGLLGIPFIGHGFSAVILGGILLAVLYVVLNLKDKQGNYFLRKRLLNTSLLCMLMLMIGYSSYAIIVVRSTANPPMDQDSPEDVFSLGSYLGREQYGDKPLLKGPAFTSYQYAAMNNSIDMKKRDYWHPVEKTDPNQPDSYEDVLTNVAIQYPAGLQMFFPRIFDWQHEDGYRSWLNDNISMHQVDFQTKDGNMAYGELPSQWDNLLYFLRYQVNFMYWRYFMWNFSGRQNGYQGQGESEKGNWITGIPVIDNFFYGDQSKLPDYLKNDKGHNVFFMLPLLLGIVGIFFQTMRSHKGTQQFWIVFFLFFMTGLAIILYLNQTPREPRERDYAYAGSFYAFAIWIGLGVIGLTEWVEKRIKERTPKTAIAMGALCLFVPLQMVSQTWDDHDRSGRYICRDFGLDYINTTPEKLANGQPAHPILFTNGDNDTFPLWYNQETEGQRTDARICNLQYLQTEWYTDQMKRPAYDSPALPIAWERSEYVDNGKHSYFPIKPEMKVELDHFKAQHPNGPDPYELTYIIDNYVRKKGYIPTDSVVVKVNRENVLNQQMEVPEGMDIPQQIPLSLKWAYDRSRGMYRADVMIYEMLARNEWKRPMYMSVTLGYNNYAGLHDYLVLEGLAYRITPFKRKMGVVDATKMYHNLMQRYHFGNTNQKGIFLDETNLRLCQSMRRMFVILAQDLIEKGQKAKAAQTLKKCEKELPNANVPYELDDILIAKLWLDAGQTTEAERVATLLANENLQYLEWFNTLPEQAINARTASIIDSYTNAVRAMSLLYEMKSKKLPDIDKKLSQLQHTTIGRLCTQYMMQQMQTHGQ